MSGRDSDPRRWRQPRPSADESTSNDSIIDLSNEDSDNQQPSQRSTRAPPTVPTPGGSSAGFVRYAHGSPWTANLPHTPDQDDDSESSSGPLRRPVPAVERVLRLPDFSRFAGRDVVGSAMMTPPARTGTAGQDEWLMGRRMASPPAGRPWGMAGMTADPRYQQTPSDTTFDTQPGFRPFPLPPPARLDLYGRTLGAEGGLQRDAARQSTSGDQSGMDFTMASYTSPTQPAGPTMGSNDRAHLGAPPRSPPTIESIEREIAYWRRNPSTMPGQQAVTSPLETPHLSPRASSGVPARTGPGVAGSSTIQDGPSRMTQGLAGGLAVETRLHSAATAGTLRGDSTQPGRTTATRRLEDVSIRERYREGSLGDSMDVSDDNLPDTRPGASSASAVVPRSQTRPQEHLTVPREPQLDISASDSEISSRTRSQIQNISDSLISSDATMERGNDLAVDDGGAGHPRIDEEPELEHENSRDQDSLDKDEEEGEGEGEDEEEEEDDDDESNASSTRHLRDDELETLILQNGLGFHGSFAPGSRIGTFESMESDNESDSASEFEENVDPDGSHDELGIRPATNPTKPGGAVAARHRKRKRKSSNKKRSVFDIEKRREQWLSEMEDRALRRGPVMGISQEEFKNDMLEPKEWKQLIDHELSDAAWRYIPVIGPGFVPYADLAQVSHSGPAVRPLPRAALPPGAPHVNTQRRHVTMAEMAMAYEATAFGQAGEEYGIRVLPLEVQNAEHHFMDAVDGRENIEHTVSDSHTEVPTLGLEANGDQRSGLHHRHGYLEGSFGRLNVEDSHRLRNVHPSR